MAKNKTTLSLQDRTLVRDLVEQYRQNHSLFEVMLSQLHSAIHGSSELMKYVHSTKSRLKDPVHLRDKLIQKIKLAREKGRTFPINEANLFKQINDLAGFRILHLHTQQIVPIDRALQGIFAEYRWPLVEAPTARTWDDENREFFRRVGIRSIKSPSMYTSVHYVIKSNNRTTATCEIQVRTLAEELWGEVDHTLNYRQKSPSFACREQIKVLARVTSSCSRLVDSIFETSRLHKLSRRASVVRK